MVKSGQILAMLVLSCSVAQAADFYPISSISYGGSSLWGPNNLIQGPGVGFDASEPHGKTLGAAAGNWVTDAPGGFPSDYIAVAGMPVLTLDLGEDRLLSEISTWGYDVTNTNGVSEFGLRFATEAEGSGNWSSSQGSFLMTIDDTIRQSNALTPVTARYVEFTAIDNFFFPPGDGSTGGGRGGDRVGLGEIAFEVTANPVIPEPASVLGLLVGGGLMLMRRK